MYNIKCLTKNEQAEIVKLYSSGNYTQQELADWQCVSVDTIRRVLKNAEEAKRSKVTISGDITVKVNSDVVIAPVAKSDIIWNASKKFISITVDGVTYNATPNTHSNFQEILNLLVADKLEEAAQKLMFVALLKNIFPAMFELKVEACSIKILNCDLVWLIVFLTRWKKAKTLNSIFRSWKICWKTQAKKRYLDSLISW